MASLWESPECRLLAFVDRAAGKPLLSYGISTLLLVFPFLRKLRRSSYALCWHHPFPPNSGSEMEALLFRSWRLLTGMSSPLTTYPRALPAGNSNKSITGSLEKLIDDKKAGITCAPLPLSLHHQGGSAGLNHFKSSKLKE